MTKRNVKTSTRIRANEHTYKLVEPRWNDFSISTRRMLRQMLSKILLKGGDMTVRRLSELEKRLRAFCETHNAECEQLWAEYYEQESLYKVGKGEKPTKPEKYELASLNKRPHGDTVPIQLKDHYEHGMMLAPQENIKKRVHIVTSGQIGATAMDNLWKTFKQYEKERDAAIWVGCSTYGRLQIDEGGFIESTMDDIFNGHLVLDTDIHLNKNVVLDTTRIRPTLAGPLSGLDKMRDTKSHFFFHPKNDLKYIATPSDADPRFVAVTASCTIPDYSTNKLGQQDKTGEFAKRNHVFGGWIVEIESDELYHVRPIVADKNGCFSDCYYDKKGNYVVHRFTPNGVQKSTVSGSLLGDPHFAVKPDIDIGMKWGTDPAIFDATIEFINALNVKTVAAGDTLDGHSCGHHDESDKIMMQKKFKAGLLDMEREFDNWCDTYRILFRETSANFIDIAANHTNEHPYRYLKEHRFLGKGHPLNAINETFGMEWCAKLVKSASTNVIELYARTNFTDEENSRISFTNRMKSYVIQGVNFGIHGDKGANGARWSPNTGNTLGGYCMVGHSHSPSINGLVWTVGTMSYLDAHYVGYLGSWMHTHGIIFESKIKDEPGQPMLVNIVDGKFGWNPKTHPKETRNFEELFQIA